MGSRDDYESWALDATAPLFRHALMLIRDRQLAEDLVQETLIKMYIRWPRIDHGAQPTAYAKQTLYRMFVSRRRLKSAGEVVTDTLPPMHAPEVDPSGAIDLGRALGQLKPGERAVVVARYGDGLPVAEVAELLGRSQAWVRTTASRALRKLRTSPDLAHLG